MIAIVIVMVIMQAKFRMLKIFTFNNSDSSTDLENLGGLWLEGWMEG